MKDKNDRAYVKDREKAGAYLRQFALVSKRDILVYWVPRASIYLCIGGT